MKPIEMIAPFKKWLTTQKRYKIAFGGRGGGKSETIARLLIAISFKRSGRILCARETLKSMSYSVYPLLVSLIQLYQLENYFIIQKNFIINKISGCTFLFLGLRETSVDNIKSIHNIQVCFIDEAHSITEVSFDKLKPSVRGKNSEIWCAINPTNITDTIYKYIISLNCDYTNYQYKYNNELYNYKEYEDKDNLILNINYDGNCFFPDVLEKERLYSLNKEPHKYNHIWLGALDYKVGRIFKASKLNFYDTDDISLKNTLSNIPLRCIIDPAFGDKSCFHCVLLYKFYNGKIYLIDGGLLRGNDIDTEDEVIIKFLEDKKPNQILIESNFAQSQLVKKMSRFYNNVKGFKSTQNKLQRIVDYSILVNEVVYFPELWKQPPDIKSNHYTDLWQGRGYLFLQQVLNFSDDSKENCIKNDDTSFIDAPDNLTNILIHDNNYAIVESDTYTYSKHNTMRGWTKLN